MTSKLPLYLLYSDGLSVALGFTGVNSEMLYWLHLRMLDDQVGSMLFSSVPYNPFAVIAEKQCWIFWPVHGPLKGSQPLFMLASNLEELKTLWKSVAHLLWLWSGRSGILYPLHTVANHACDGGKSSFSWDFAPAVAGLNERWMHCIQHHWCSGCPWCPGQASIPSFCPWTGLNLRNSWQIFVETPCSSKASFPSMLLPFPLKIFPECLAWIFFCCHCAKTQNA